MFAATKMILREIQRRVDGAREDHRRPLLTVGGYPDNEVVGQSRDCILQFWIRLLAEDFSSEERHQAYATVFAGINAFENAMRNDSDNLLDHAGGEDVTAVDVVWWTVVGLFLSFLREEKVAQFHRVAPRITTWHRKMSERPEFCDEAVIVPQSERNMRKLRRCLNGKASGGMATIVNSVWFSLTLFLVLLGLMYLSANHGFLQSTWRGH